jgi:hypothetical protein
MSGLRVSNLRGETAGSSPTFPDGVVVTGVITATSFSGSGASLTGIDATALKDSGGSVKVQANTSGIVVTGVATATTFSGNVTGVAATFSGNVSVGGVLTYEDVTNVDSVGLITARSGIKIGAGQSVSAVSGIVTYYGDGSQLTGVESGVGNFVASGTIPNGATVVINTDGTVGIVTLTGSADPNAGTAVVFESASANDISATYDSTNQKVVIAYKDVGNNNYATAIVGTVSGSSITFGTANTFYSAASASFATAYDSTNSKVVIAWGNSGGSNGRAVVGTVSGTSIGFNGSTVQFNASTTTYIKAVYDSTNEKVVITYRDDGNSDYGTAIVGTVSGDSISFGSEVVFNSANTYGGDPVYDSTNGKVVIAYTDAGNSSHGTAIVGTVSGTSISFGSEVVFNSASVSYTSIAFDSTNGKVVIAYRVDSTDYGTAIVGTVSGTSISFGTAVTFESANSYYISATFDSSAGKVVIAYNDAGNSNYGTAIVGTVSGTSISFGTAVVFESGITNYTSCAYDSTNEKVVIAYTDGGNSNYGTAVVLSTSSQTTNLTAENYIGIAAEAISNTATGKINIIGGVNTGQTGLTTAQTYYVQTNGTLATSAGSPSVVAGTSISDTKVLVWKS